MNILSSGFFSLNFLRPFIDKNNFSLLDHIISNDNSKSLIIFQNIQSISDHHMIFFPLDIRTGKHRQVRQITENSILLFSSTMVEAAVNEFKNIFMKHFEKAFLVKISKIKTLKKSRKCIHYKTVTGFKSLKAILFFYFSVK